MRERREAVEFDLSAAARSPEPSDSSDGDPSPRRKRSWRGQLIGLGVVAVIVGGLAVGTGIQDRQATEALLDDGHGLRPLAQAPTEQWSAPADYAVKSDGALVVISDGVARAIDPATGLERWSHDLGLGSEVNCGGYIPVRGVVDGDDDPLVCITEDPPYRVTTIEDGELVATREFDVPTGANLSVGPNGSIVFAERDGNSVGGGTTADIFTPRENGGTTEIDVPPVEGANVWSEDAVTGEERWTQHLDPAISETLGRCLHAAPDGSPIILADDLSVYSQGDLISVDGCGVTTALSGDGVMLADIGSETEIGQLPDGRIFRTPNYGAGSAGAKSQILAEDGTVERTVDGRILSPDATDGTDVPLLVGAGSLKAFDGDDELWTAPIGVDSIAAATHDAVVVLRGYSMTALDPETGVVLWEEDLPSAQLVSSAYIDGDRVIVHRGDLGDSPSEDSLTWHLEARGLIDGDAEWSLELDDRGLMVADGRLILWEDGQLVGLG